MLVWEVMTKFTFPQSFGKSIVSLWVSDLFQCGAVGRHGDVNQPELAE